MNNNLQEIDFNHVNQLVNGDEEFKKELIKIFINQIPEFIDNMSQFFKSNNLEKLAREAHTAKSSVLIFGMTNTGKLLKDIQLWAEEGKADKIPQALQQAETDLKNALKVLKEYLKLE